MEAIVIPLSATIISTKRTKKTKSGKFPLFFLLLSFLFCRARKMEFLKIKIIWRVALNRGWFLKISFFWYGIVFKK
jgi:hypothetical protein